MADKTLVIDLSAPARASDVPALAQAFLRWWGGELASMLPTWLVGAPRPRTTLYASNDAWRISSPGNGARPFTVAPSASDQDLAEQLMRDGAKHELSRLDVVLPRASALIRHVELPIMSDAAARSAVELQIDRLSPFAADAARFAYRVIERDEAAGKMDVEVAIIPAARIEPLERRLQNLGLAPASIDVEGADGERVGFNLRTPPNADDRRRRRVLDLSIALAAAIVWMFALHAWGTAADSEIANWQLKIAELRPAAEQSAALRRRIDALTAPYAIANAHDPARALTILDELTRVLPNDTRVLDFKLDGDDLRIQGLSAGAPELIAKLEASKLFKDVKFASPLTRRAETTLDRFEISMHVERASR